MKNRLMRWFIRLAVLWVAERVARLLADRLIGKQDEQTKQAEEAEAA